MGYGEVLKYDLSEGKNVVRLMDRENITKSFSYVPSHLHHMVFELLKNSMRAIVDRYGVDADTFPPIKMVFAEGKEDITIKISDEGGGIPRSGMVSPRHF
jgi:DNA gyrase/topoisomerase IV subunit B